MAGELHGEIAREAIRAYLGVYGGGELRGAPTPRIWRRNMSWFQPRPKMLEALLIGQLMTG